MDFLNFFSGVFHVSHSLLSYLTCLLLEIPISCFAFFCSTWFLTLFHSSMPRICLNFPPWSPNNQHINDHVDDWQGKRQFKWRKWHCHILQILPLIWSDLKVALYKFFGWWCISWTYDLVKSNQGLSHQAREEIALLMNGMAKCLWTSPSANI